MSKAGQFQPFRVREGAIFAEDEKVNCHSNRVREYFWVERLENFAFMLVVGFPRRLLTILLTTLAVSIDDS